MSYLCSYCPELMNKCKSLSKHAKMKQLAFVFRSLATLAITTAVRTKLEQTRQLFKMVKIYLNSNTVSIETKIIVQC